MALAVCACSAQDTWELYYSPEQQAEAPRALKKRVQPMLPPGVKLTLHPLPADCKDTEAARQHARAIAAGVHTLPCLVLKDAKGSYAALPLSGLTARGIAQAQAQAGLPEREKAVDRRAGAARLYYMRALWMLAGTPDNQDRVIATYRREMQQSDVAMRQNIGYYCLYPALMQQYTGAYAGAHTPYTEAKLLEAISVLEQVRDADPESPTGRLAFDERERLRAARLQARQSE